MEDALPLRLEQSANALSIAEELFRAKVALVHRPEFCFRQESENSESFPEIPIHDSSILRIKFVYHPVVIEGSNEVADPLNSNIRAVFH